MGTEFASNQNILIFCLITPIVYSIIYILIFRVISISKKQAVQFIVFLIITSLVTSYWLLTTYPFFTHTTVGHLFFSLILHMVLILGVFPVFEYYYKVAICFDKEQFGLKYFPSQHSKIVSLYDNPTKVKIIAGIGRYSLITSKFFLVAGVIYIGFSQKFDYPKLGVYSFLPMLCSGVFFLIASSFLRMLVKCPNCNLDIFFIDVNKYAYYNVAKRILKDNVMECWHCHAAYALDPAMDLDKLREENIKNWEDRADIVKSLDQERKSSLKYI